MKKSKLLIVDDHEGFRESLMESPILLSKYYLYEAANGEKALEIVKEDPNIACILLDYDLKGKKHENIRSGLEIMEEMKTIAPQIPIFMMSGITDQRGSVAIESIKQNAICFLDKPFSINLLMKKLDEVLNELKNEEKDDQKILQKFQKNGFIAKSNSMIKVCIKAEESSKNNLSLMIIGETGTGKTALANAIHK